MATFWTMVFMRFQRSYFIIVPLKISGLLFYQNFIRSHPSSLAVKLHDKANVFALDYVQCRFTTTTVTLRCGRETGFQCSCCFLTFRCKSSLDNHFKRTHAERTIKCPLCEAAFVEKRSLNLHLSQHLRKYVCGICDKAFSAPSVLKIHESRHRDERPFVCETCGAAFKGQFEKRRHMRDMHGSGSLCCAKCGLGFVKAAHLTAHLKLHELPEDPLNKFRTPKLIETGFQCSSCSLTFRCKSSLDNHFKRTHTAKTFKCPRCEAAFVCNSSLQLHLNKHLRKYVCRFCARACVSPSALIEHESRHRDERSFVCEQCGATFKGQYEMRKHIRVVHGSGNLCVCDKCGLGFENAKDMFIHLKVHELPEQQIKTCELCNGAFASDVALDIHKRSCV